MLLFATLFILGDKKVVQNVSRQEAGRNQAGARRGARLQCHGGTWRWNLSYPKTLSQLLPSSWSFSLGFEFLEFKSNNIHHRHAMPPTSRQEVSSEKKKKKSNEKGKNTERKKSNCPVHEKDPLPVRRADSEQKPFVDLVMMA